MSTQGRLLKPPSTPKNRVKKTAGHPTKVALLTDVHTKTSAMHIQASTHLRMTRDLTALHVISLMLAVFILCHSRIPRSTCRSPAMRHVHCHSPMSAVTCIITTPQSCHAKPIRRTEPVTWYNCCRKSKTSLINSETQRTCCILVSGAWQVKKNTIHHCRLRSYYRRQGAKTKSHQILVEKHILSSLIFEVSKIKLQTVYWD